MCIRSTVCAAAQAGVTLDKQFVGQSGDFKGYESLLKQFVALSDMYFEIPFNHGLAVTATKSGF